MLNNGQKIPPGGGYKRGFAHTYEDIISLKSLLEAWKEFRRGKRGKLDVLEFQSDLIQQVTRLHNDLRQKFYRHGGYHHFRISDPKPRDIHKASVRDRLLHHAIYRVFYPFFDRTFIHDSYSCRVGKGTHRAMNRFRAYAQKCSRNHTRTCWVLKCDIRKFFASIDHATLLAIVERHVADPDTRWLLGEIIDSFSSRSNLDGHAVGLPLGNLTSQLLVNIYMNEFDQFVKHQLKAKYYIRYADDFVLLSRNKNELEKTLPYMEVFLRDELKLQLHPNKVSLQTFASGVDFLGWTHLPDHRVLRTTTKRRMLRRVEGLEEENLSVQSYLGLLSHGNTQKLKQEVKKRLL